MNMAQIAWLIAGAIFIGCVPLWVRTAAIWYGLGRYCDFGLSIVAGAFYTLAGCFFVWFALVHLA